MSCMWSCTSERPLPSAELCGFAVLSTFPKLSFYGAGNVMRARSNTLRSFISETIISNNSFAFNQGPVIGKLSQPSRCRFELSHTKGLMSTWTEWSCSEIFFIFLLQFCYVVMYWIHGVRSWLTHIQMCSNTVSSHVLPALLVIPQTNYNVFSSSFLLLQFPCSIPSPSSCNWIWMKMAFPFLLYSSLLWLKRDLPGEITHKHRYMQACKTSTQRHYIGGKAFFLTNTPTHSWKPSLACTKVTCCIARGQRPLLLLLYFTFFLFPFSHSHFNC